MKHPRREFLRLAAGAAALPVVGRIAWAQTYPTRPITLNVPYAAGGPLDVMARVIADGLRASLITDSMASPVEVTPTIESPAA
jgi:tripartite-type tricarboxylate transporter receptor subunit TctC